MNKPLRSVWQGTFQVFGVEVKCHVLSDGRRIIEEDSVVALLQAMDVGLNPVDDEMLELAKWLLEVPSART